MPENILFVVPYAPNLIRVRPYNLIRHLVERGNRVTLLTLWSDEGERESLRSLEGLVDKVVAVRLPRWRSLLNCLAALPTRQPLQSAFCWQPELAHHMDALLQKGEGGQDYDVAHVEHLRGARFGLYLKTHPRPGGRPLPVVWDSVDSISLLFRQAAVRSRSAFNRTWTRFELARTEPYEAWLLGQFDRVTVTSPHDARALTELRSALNHPASTSAAPVEVIPNGVDLEYFRPDPAVAREPATLVVSGKMSYHANVTMVLHLANQILPLIWARRPDACLWVVGKDPSPELQALAKDPRITITGTVADLPPYLQRATVAVAPIAYGAGIQNKVLEAMACGTPVVASSPAVSALQAAPGRDLLVASEPEEFASAVLALLEDRPQQLQVGQAGREYVETYHHWGKAAARLEEIYAQVRRNSH